MLPGNACAEGEVRPAKVAGQFYPAESEALRAMVDGLLAKQRPGGADKPRVLIAPHAGYQYSGAVAAAAFRRVQGRAYDGVVVVGFTHRAQFDGASVDPAERYVTPLGDVAVDREAVAQLLALPGISAHPEAHAMDEHSLEVELPFLQRALGTFWLVPVLMGNARLEDAGLLADALARLAERGDYLFVFSTDLSHDHPEAAARQIDRVTVGALEGETPYAVARLFGMGRAEACGRGPILTALLLAERLGYLRREHLAYATSADATGDVSRVVGYTALAFVDRPRAEGAISSEAGHALVRAARTTLEQTLGRVGAAASAPAEALEEFPDLGQAAGIFVTLRRRGALRGCIGRIMSEEPLTRSLPAVALDAALSDPRFASVRAEELSELHIEVSVLSPPQRLAALRELVPGRDGVVLEQGGHRGVFLPQVWEETGWTRAEFLSELASQKAGLPPDAWQTAVLSTFQAQVFEE